MKKSLFLTMLALSSAAFLLMAQDGSKFNGTWKSEAGQVRKLTWKDGVIFMEEENAKGPQIMRQYPTKGQELTMPDGYGFWKDSKATGKMDGNKLVVDTTMPTGMQWHDEWTMAEDGKSYKALRVMVSPGTGGKGGGATKGKAAGPPEPETFTKIQ